MSLLDKEPVKRVGQILKDFNPNLKVIVLETSARTAQEAASSLGCEVGAIVKSLLFKTENTFTLCLVAGDKKASLNKIKKNLKIKDASMASGDEVKNSGKPKELAEKISKGKISKFLNDNSLLNQIWIMDPKKTVKDILKENSKKKEIKVLDYIRYKVGEGV